MDLVGKSELSLRYKDGSVVTYLDPLVKTITWSGELATATRKVEVSLQNTNDGRKQAFNIKLGKEVYLFNNGKEIFRGIIFNRSMNQAGEMSFSAFDSNIYLTKNGATRKYTNKKASDIIKSLCNEFGIKYGNMTDTGYVFPKLIFRNKSIWDMMIIAITETSKATGKKYYLGNKKGKLELYLRSEQLTQFVIEGGRNLLASSYSINMEETKTQVELVGGETGDIKVVKKNDNLISQYGVMQHSEEKTDLTTKAQLEAFANQLLKDMSKLQDEASVEAIGIDTVYAGTSVYAYDTMTGISGSYYVLADSHTFEGGTHKMSLTLSKTDELPKMDYEPPQENTSSQVSSSSGSYGGGSYGGLPTGSGGRYNIPTSLRNLIVNKLKSFGIPTWIGSAIIEVESKFNPKAQGDYINGAYRSFGLLQLYTTGGQGNGYTKEQLFDPDRNLNIGLPYIRDAYNKGVRDGLKGWELLKYTCSHSGHPSHNGTWTTGYLDLLKKSYDNGDELALKIDGTETTGKESNRISTNPNTRSYIPHTYLPSLAVSGVKRTYASDKAYVLAMEHGLKLTSAYRSPFHPESIINPKSDHVKGTAYDFAGTTAQMDKYCKALLKNGLRYKQIIWRNQDQYTKNFIPFHQDHIHVAWHYS